MSDDLGGLANGPGLYWTARALWYRAYVRHLREMRDVLLLPKGDRRNLRLDQLNLRPAALRVAKEAKDVAAAARLAPADLAASAAAAAENVSRPQEKNRAKCLARAAVLRKQHAKQWRKPKNFRSRKSTPKETTPSQAGQPAAPPPAPNSVARKLPSTKLSNHGSANAVTGPLSPRATAVAAAEEAAPEGDGKCPNYEAEQLRLELERIEKYYEARREDTLAFCENLKKLSRKKSKSRWSIFC